MAKGKKGEAEVIKELEERLRVQEKCQSEVNRFLDQLLQSCKNLESEDGTYALFRHPNKLWWLIRYDKKMYFEYWIDGEDQKLRFKSYDPKSRKWLIYEA